MKSKPKKRFFLLLFTIVAAGAGFLFYLFSSPSIHYQYTAEIGDEIIVKAPFWINESQLRNSFTLEPATKTEMYWIASRRELRVVPKIPLNKNTVYIAQIKLTSLFSATIYTKGATAFIHPKIIMYPPVPSPEEWERMKQIPAATYVAEGKFIDVNLETMTVSLFQDGRLVRQVPVAGKGNPARSPTREGIFNIKTKEQNHFSRLSYVWMPLSMNYSGDYFIHGWPYWPNGEKLTSQYSGGCVRIADEDAQTLFQFANIGTPVRVHSTPAEKIITSLPPYDGHHYFDELRPY